MDTLPPTAHGGQDGLTIEQASLALGLSPRTVRRMVKRGELASGKIDGPHGPQYMVRLDPGQAGTVANGHAGQNGTVDVQQGGHGHGAPAGQPTRPRQGGQASLVPLVTELIHRVAVLEQERFELAGRLGYFQAQLEQAQTTIKALSPPAAPNEAAFAQEPAAPAETTTASPRPWWRFW